MRRPAFLLFLLFWLGSAPSQALAQAWSQRSSAPTPPGRAYHAMAYDSVRGVTVLYGGRTSSGLVGDTWEWNGTAWRQCFPSTSPGIRGFHAMAYDSLRQVVVLFGGFNNLSTWQVVKTSKKISLFFVPVAKWSHEYFMVCPVCSAALQMASAAQAQAVLAAALQRDEDLERELMEELTSDTCEPYQAPA